MKVNIDLDMVAHELGHLRKDTGDTDDEGNPIKKLFHVNEVAPIAKGRVMSIIMGAQAGGWQGFLTRGKHYRYDLATMLPYKGHREGAPRNNVDKLKDIFHKEMGAIWCDDNEADDAMAIEQWQDILSVGPQIGFDLTEPGASDYDLRDKCGTVIATRDKDLNTVPGWHFTWWLKGGKNRKGEYVTEEVRTVQKGEAYWVTIAEAFRNFYKQCLTGDTADNIKGLHGIGPKSAWLKQLDDMVDEEDMYDHVAEKYTKFYGSYGDKFLKEVGSLLHMQRRPGDRWLAPHERDEHYWYL